MALESRTSTIPGPDDVEIGIARSSRITYHVTAPPGMAKGLVFVIHGFGGDTDGGYDAHLREHIAQTYGMAAVTVEYHCYRSRPPLGATIDLPSEEVQLLQRLAREAGLEGAVAISSELLQSIGARISESTVIKGQLIPPDGDYQNFGVLQALDHLYVLEDLIQKGYEFDRGRIWAFGSSHGGYVAHLLHKFAPATISAVIDNSGYTCARKKYLGLGVEYSVTFGRLILACSLSTRWNLVDPDTPCYFGVAQELIRNTAYSPHVHQVARVSKSSCRFRMCNSKDDKISPLSSKRKQQAMYQSAGFDIELLEFGGDAGSPGFVKSAEHADVSLKKLFDHFAPGLLERRGSGVLDRDAGTELIFDCAEARYRIRHRTGSTPVVLSIDRS